MKKVLLIIFALLTVSNSYSQDTSSITEMINKAVKAFTWDIEKVKNKGTLMFLNVPYERNNTDSIEYLTLIVAKDKAKQRPNFISIIIPNNIIQTNGIFIMFARTATKNRQQPMEFEKGNLVRVNFEHCNDETCTARIINGYASGGDGKNEDIFQKFLDFDRVFFLFIYPDGSYKPVVVPLFSFQQQYKKLE